VQHEAALETTGSGVVSGEGRCVSSGPTGVATIGSAAYGGAGVGIGSLCSGASSFGACLSALDAAPFIVAAAFTSTGRKSTLRPVRRPRLS
jgi:hypothetical protein